MFHFCNVFFSAQANAHKRWNPPSFEKDNVRVVIFRDQDNKGRSLIFDSSVVVPIVDKQTCQKWSFGKTTPCRKKEGKESPLLTTKHTPLRQLSDTKMLGEMMFGSVAMAYRGTTLKVHSIRTPPQIMITEVFIVSRSNKEHVGGHESFDGLSTGTESSCPRQTSICDSIDSTDQSIAHSVAVNVPMSQEALEDADNEDSGLSASVTSSCSSFNLSYPSPGSSSSVGSASYTSRQRRYRRSQATSLEHNLAKRCSDDMISVPLRKRPAKFGLGIIFSLPEDDPGSRRQFENFFFSHITLIEGHVFRLRKAVERALNNKTHFASLTIEGVDMFRSSICDLYTTPRLPQPVWLHMMAYSTHKVALCDHFLRDFMQVFEKYDTKSTKFFLSTVVTAVLTNHLAWVPTVTPAGAAPSRNYMDKHTARWMDALAKSHPYNPLWAQLGDLYGAVGFPLRLSRTVVTGKKVDVVSRFINVLSYFVRCSEVHENLQSHGPFSRDSDSALSTETLTEESSLDGDDLHVDPVFSHPSDGPSRTKRDSGGSTFETTLAVKTPVLEGESGGFITKSSIGARGASCDIRPSCDVWSSTPELKSSTVWYVDLPCEMTDAEAGEKTSDDNHGNEDSGELVCQIDTHRSCADQHTACETVASGSPTWVRNETETGICGSIKSRCRERCKNVVTPSECCSNQGLAVPSSPCSYKADTVKYGKITTGGHRSCDIGVAAACSTVNDTCIQTSGQHNVLQPLFLFRSFDQCQNICLPTTGKNIAADDVSDCGRIHAEHSSVGRQKSAASRSDSELKIVGDLNEVKGDVSHATETSIHVDCVNDTQVSSTDVNDASGKCQLSPTFIREEPRMMRVRLVGRMAPPEISEARIETAPEPCDVKAKFCNDHQVAAQEDSGSTSDVGNSLSSQRGFTDMSDSDSCHTASSDYLLQVDVPGISQGSSPGVYSTRSKEGFHDSGVFEVPSTEAVTYSDVARTDARDSGFSSTDFEGGQPAKTEDTVVLSSHSDTTETSSGASTLCNEHTTPTRFTFSRSNSMFDEYFKEEPTGDTVDQMSADVFNEYLDAPMPDVNELRKFSVSSQDAVSTTKPYYARLPSMEESPSMFDEYFVEESSKISGAESRCQTNTSELVENTVKKQLDFEPKRQLETLRNDAETERSGAGVFSSMRRKHKSEETVPRKNSLLGRQISMPMPSGNLSRTRSTTPTEFVRRRHFSTVSGTSTDSVLNLTEVPMPRSEVLEDTESALLFNRNFGSSLIAGYSDHYLSDFVLHGTSNSNFHSRLHADLTTTLQNSVLDEPITETVCIVADTDKWTVRRLTCHYSSSDRVKTQDVTESNLVYNILESVHDLWKLKMSPEFCLMHLEDRLQEIYFKSKMLSEYLCVHQKLCMKELSRVLGIDKSDIPLLLAVAGTHTSYLAMGLL